MPSNRDPQPLVDNQPIVTAGGTPTQYFIRWCQERQKAISTSVTIEKVRQLITAYAAGRKIIAGVGLNGGGDLSADRTINLGDTTVTPGTYGDATHVARIAVDQQGRITSAVEVAITGGGGGGGIYAPLVNGDLPGPTPIATGDGQFIMVRIG